MERDGAESTTPAELPECRSNGAATASYCPIEATLNLLNGKWTLHVIRALLAGRMRFNEIQRRIGSVSARTLTLRLKELEAHGLLQREVLNSIPPWVEYELTEKGLALNQALGCLAYWGREWMAEGTERREPTRNGSDPGPRGR